MCSIHKIKAFSFHWNLSLSISYKQQQKKTIPNIRLIQIFTRSSWKQIRQQEKAYCTFSFFVFILRRFTLCVRCVVEAPPLHKRPWGGCVALCTCNRQLEWSRFNACHRPVDFSFFLPLMVAFQWENAIY